MKWTPLDKMDSMDKMDNMDKIRQFRPKNAKFHKSQSEGLRKDRYLDWLSLVTKNS